MKGEISPPPPHRSWTFTVLWESLLFVYHLPRRVPSLEASQPCSLLLDFCYWFHLTFPFRGSTAPPGSAAEATFTSSSCVLSHGDSRTLGCHHQKASCSNCPPMPSKTGCLYLQVLVSLHIGHNRPIVESMLVVWGMNPQLPFRWPQVLLGAALPVVHLKSGHSDEVQLWPKVRSSLDALGC